MKNFKDFINEEHQVDPLYIEVDSRLLENNKDSMNADFDRLTAAPFQNSIIFYNQLRGTLERYGMVIPPGATKHFLNFDAELSFKLGDGPLFLYVVFNTHKNTKVEAYAQVVDESELDELMNSEDEVPRGDEEEDDVEEMGDDNEDYRKRDSDAGDTSEY